jgi:hypothetical protein
LRQEEFTMSNLEIILIAVVVVLAAAVAWLLVASRRSKHLRSKFGPEYERAVGESGSRSKAERDLARREERVEKLSLHSLPPGTQDRFAQSWRTIQSRFVDDPQGSTLQADHLVDEVMRERGYPVANFEHRADDISVDHPHVVQNYRAAREIVVRQERGQADTEDLRRALVYYRALFDELLETPQEAIR